MLRHGKRILRAVASETVPHVERLIASPWFRVRVAAGTIPETTWLGTAPSGMSTSGEFRWLEHSVLRFPCYPHEITATQLHEAALLTLSLAEEALQNGWLLKDGSAWNVLFDGGRPVFCDILSFVPGESSRLWPGYAQFQRHFIIPLLLHRQLGIRPSEIFVTRREGFDPQEARSMLRGWAAWRQPALEAVTLPSMLGRHGGVPRGLPISRRGDDAELSRYLLTRTFRRLRNHLHRLQPQRRPSSAWADYQAERDHYTETDLSAKRTFVSEALADPHIDSVLDLGCNTGEFSFLAAQLGKRVVAADFDAACLERLQVRMREQNLAVQTLILDLGRPTPAVGWLNEEIPGVLARARGRFDCILMLGLVHHLLVSERATLAQLERLLQILQPATLLIEWIESHDRRFQEIAATNASLYADLSHIQFEQMLQRKFRIERSAALAGNARWLYHCTRSAR